MAELQISKLDAARRQLETAVRLYFVEGDPVSIHTLVAAAYELLRNLNAHRGGEPMMIKDSFPQYIAPEMRKEFVRRINEAENFFKHAERDPEKMLTFNPWQSDILLLDACEKYQELTGERLPLLRIYQMWSWLTWARKYLVDADDFMKRATALQVHVSGKTRQSFFSELLPFAYAIGLDDLKGGA